MKSIVVIALLVTSCILLFIGQTSCHEHKDHKDKLEGAGKQKRGISDLKDTASSSSTSSEESKESRRKRGAEEMMAKSKDAFGGDKSDEKSRRKRGTEDIKESVEGGAKKFMEGVKDTVGVFQGFLAGKTDKKERKRRDLPKLDTDNAEDADDDSEGSNEEEESSTKTKRSISEQDASSQSSDQARKRRLVHYDVREAYQTVYTFA